MSNCGGIRIAIESEQVSVMPSLVELIDLISQLGESKNASLRKLSIKSISDLVKRIALSVTLWTSAP